MNRKKIVILVAIIMVMAFAATSCSLFGGGEQAAAADGEKPLPELTKRFYYVPGDFFVVNLKPEDAAATDDGTATAAMGTPPLVKATVAMAFDKDMTADLDKNQQAIRNICVKVLRDMTETEARADNAIETLEKKLYDELNEFLNMPEFYGVYISDFVVQ